MYKTLIMALAVLISLVGCGMAAPTGTGSSNVELTITPDISLTGALGTVTLSGTGPVTATDDILVTSNVYWDLKAYDDHPLTSGTHVLGQMTLGGTALTADSSNPASILSGQANNAPAGATITLDYSQALSPTPYGGTYHATVYLIAQAAP